MTFALTFIFMIMVFWRPQEWLFPWMFGWPILDVVVAISVVTLYLEVDQGKLKFPKEWPQVFLLGGLWFAAVFSHIAHTYWAGMVATIIPVFKVCFFTLLLFCVLDRLSRLRAVAVAFVVMACFMAVHALMQESTGYGFANQRPLYFTAERSFVGFQPHGADTYAFTRSYFFGIFHDPNDLAQMLACSIPFAFVIFRKRFWSLVAGCLVSWLLIEGIMSTHSRGGYIALAVTAVSCIALLLPARWMPYLAVIVLAAALALAPRGGALMDESAQERIVYWGWANQAFKQQPLFGLGFGMFWQVVDRKTAHNAFVLCYTTLGIFGYFFWYNLIQTGIIGAWRTRKALTNAKTTDEAWLMHFAGIAMVAMVSFCTAAYFLSRTFVYPFFFLAATLGAVPVIAQKLLPGGSRRLVRMKKDVFIWGTIGTLLSIVYIYISIILLNKGYYG